MELNIWDICKMRVKGNVCSILPSGKADRFFSVALVVDESEMVIHVVGKQRHR